MVGWRSGRLGTTAQVGPESVKGRGGSMTVRGRWPDAGLDFGRHVPR